MAGQAGSAELWLIQVGSRRSGSAPAAATGWIWNSVPTASHSRSSRSPKRGRW